MWLGKVTWKERAHIITCSEMMVWLTELNMAGTLSGGVGMVYHSELSTGKKRGHLFIIHSCWNSISSLPM